jgi:hypothetical protein
MRTRLFHEAMRCTECTNAHSMLGPHYDARMPPEVQGGEWGGYTTVLCGTKAIMHFHCIMQPLNLGTADARKAPNAAALAVPSNI